MALTIRMRIDENDEHQYYYATGSGTEIELIPLVVDSNGDYVPEEGKAYKRVTVNVPSTELETLIVNTNGTYNAPDGKAYNVVQVDVKSIINLQNKSASYTSNGNYNIQADSGYDGLGKVSVAVNVPTPTPDLQSKTETYTENGSYTVTPDSGYDGLSGVDVEVNVPATPTPSIQASKSQTITHNGTVTVSPDSGYDAMEEAEITVNVPTGGNVQNLKQVTYNQNGYFEVTPDSGYDGIARVGIGIEVPTGGGGDADIVVGNFMFESSGNQTVNIPYTGSKTLKEIVIKPVLGFSNYEEDTSFSGGNILGCVVIKNETEEKPNAGELVKIYKSDKTVIASRVNNFTEMFNSTATLSNNSPNGQTIRADNNTAFTAYFKTRAMSNTVYGLNNRVDYEYLAIYE